MTQLEKINHQRRQFLGIVAMTIATTQLGRFSSDFSREALKPPSRQGVGNRV